MQSVEVFLVRKRRLILIRYFSTYSLIWRRAGYQIHTPVSWNTYSM